MSPEAERPMHLCESESVVMEGHESMLFLPIEEGVKPRVKADDGLLQLVDVAILG